MPVLYLSCLFNLLHTLITLFSYYSYLSYLVLYLLVSKETYKRHFFTQVWLEWGKWLKFSVKNKFAVVTKISK